MKDLFKPIPLSISAISLACLSLGNLLQMHSILLKHLLSILGILIYIIYILKYIFSYQDALVQLKDPTVFSLLPTFSMATMLLADYLFDYIGNITFYLWLFGLILNLLIYLAFIYKYILHYNKDTMYPTFFVSVVGFVIASVTGPTFNQILLGQILFYIGLLGYTLILILMIRYILTHPPYPSGTNLTMAIFCAPVALLITGYTSVFDTLYYPLLIPLVIIEIITYLYVIIQVILPNLFKSYYPTLSAFTFPLVISATAFTRLGIIFLPENSFLFYPIYLTHLIALIAVITVIYKFIKALYIKK